MFTSRFVQVLAAGVRLKAAAAACLQINKQREGERRRKKENAVASEMNANDYRGISF